MDAKLKRTLVSMIIGTSIYNLVLLFISVIFFYFYYKSDSNRFLLIIKNEVGLLLGYVISVIGVYSMARSIVKVTSKDDGDFAKKYMTFMARIRFIIFVIILVIIVKLCGFSSALMYMLATLGIKAGAYLAPIIEKRI